MWHCLLDHHWLYFLLSVFCRDCTKDLHGAVTQDQAVSYANRNNCDRQFHSYPKSEDNSPSFELKLRNTNTNVKKQNRLYKSNRYGTRCKVPDVDV